MWKKLWNEAASLGAERPPLPPVTGHELASLPPAARAYMAFHGVVAGAPKHWSFCVGWTGRFRMAPDRPWMPVEAVQYDLRLPVARIFHMKARMSRVLPVLVRDTYRDGRGRMLAKVADLIPLVDGGGSELDIGELVTWLDDVVLFAPSMLLGRATGWSHVDARTFDIGFTDRERTVRARVWVDRDGAPVDFETTDRYLSDPGDPKHRMIRGRWSTPVESWRRVGEQLIPVGAKATWHLRGGDFTYAELEPIAASLAFDVQPSGPGVPLPRAA